MFKCSELASNLMVKTEEKKLLYCTKTVFEILIKLKQVNEIFKWILTYYHKYEHAQPLELDL